MTLWVGAAPEHVSPGDQLGGRYEILAPPDAKAVGVIVGLTGTGRFQERETTHDSDGGSSTRHVWRTTTLHEERFALPLAPGPQEVRFRIPDWAPPSSPDAVLWKVWARIDRRGGFDRTAEAYFNVRVPADRVPPQPAYEGFGDGIRLAPLPPVVPEGSLLRGRFRVEPVIAYEARGIDVHLVRRRTYDAGSGGPIVEDTTVASVRVAGTSRFVPGSPLDLAYEIPVPFAGPTTSHARAWVQWLVRVRIDRAWASDPTVELPFVTV